MVSLTQALSLYQDWAERREELAQRIHSEDPKAQALLRLFDYLLERYRDTDRANRPALFPRRKPLHVNERAIVVHQHLGRDIASRVKTHEAAEQRVREGLGRLAVDQQKDAATASAEELMPPPIPQGRSKPTRPFTTLSWCGRRLHPKWDWEIHFALNRSPFLPATVVEQLFRRIEERDRQEDAMRAARLLIRCENRNMVQRVVRAWRRRIVKNAVDDVTRLLTEYLLDEKRRPEKLERLRMTLTDENARVRLSVIALLSRIGTLDDIGILSDLLLLPQLPDEDPNERAALMEAIERLARGNS